MNGMISCKSCLAYNSLDSTFCKKCGTTLPPDELQQAREKLEAVVADGFRSFSSGRTDEAMQVAEMAVRANPSSTAALSLKAMCHERFGQISEALECHEKVLEIDPDSMIDKIKVNDLRNLVIARSSIAAVPDRRMALLGAVAAFALVGSIGLIFAKNANRSAEKVTLNSPVSSANPNSTGTAKFDAPISPPGGATQSSTVQTPPQQQGTGTSGQTQTGRSDGAGYQEQPRTEENTKLPRLPAGDQLPNPGQNPYSPITVRPDQLPTETQPGPQQKKNPIAENHPVGDPPPTTEEPQGNSAQKQPPGVMEITVVGHGNKPSGESSDPAGHPNGVEALLRTARSKYQIGNYGEAATSYERALRAGADPASGNQRLAQCYEKLGRNSEAVAAYNRAIDALQNAIGSGRGDKDRLNAALDSCKQAVKVLGG